MANNCIFPLLFKKKSYLRGMIVIQKTYKFRLYPNKEQEKMLANYFGSVRFVYNHFLAKRKKQYEQTRKSSNYYEQEGYIVQLSD